MSQYLAVVVVGTVVVGVVVVVVGGRIVVVVMASADEAVVTGGATLVVPSRWAMINAATTNAAPTINAADMTTPAVSLDIDLATGCGPRRTYRARAYRWRADSRERMAGSFPASAGPPQPVGRLRSREQRQARTAVVKPLFPERQKPRSA